MKKEDVAVIAHLLTGMKDAAEKLEEAQKEKDLEMVSKIKKEIMNFQRQIDELL